VLHPLVNAQLLRSAKGPFGGYCLAVPASEITLLEVLEAVDGPIRGSVSRFGGKDAEQLDRRLEDVCQHLAELTRKQLQAVRIADLAGKRPRGKS
jgi:DNA-binding IscR family transcriptional regulator